MGGRNIYWLQSEGDNILGSACPSVSLYVSLFVCLLGREETLSVQGVCVLNNHADAVDRLLII